MCSSWFMQTSALALSLPYSLVLLTSVSSSFIKPFDGSFLHAIWALLFILRPISATTFFWHVCRCHLYEIQVDSAATSLCLNPLEIKEKVGTVSVPLFFCSFERFCRLELTIHFLQAARNIFYIIIALFM